MKEEAISEGAHAGTKVTVSERAFSERSERSDSEGTIHLDYDGTGLPG